jgi:phosphoribosylaminoimidazole (AIR) synthetase
MVHITGGGFFENIPRVLPAGLGVGIRAGAWEVPPIFRFIQESGGVAEREMFATFNMGIGFIMIVSPKDADRALSILEKAGEKALVIGSVTGKEGVAFC